MADSFSLQGIDESFFRCSLCLSYFREPKLLPCLHRYCKRCLENTQQKQPSNKLTCLLCSHQCTIPKKGIDGLKTDYHMEKMAEFKQIKFYFENKLVRACIGCSKESEIPAAYCFKCKDFLCYRCYQFHLKNKMVADHRNKLLSANYCQTLTFDFGKYSLLKELPKCSEHPQAVAQQCCSTCNNLLLCLVCVSSAHKGHKLCDIKSIAEPEMLQLTSLNNELTKCNDKFENFLKEISNAKERIEAVAGSASVTVAGSFQNERQKLQQMVQDHKKAIAKSKPEIEARSKIRRDSLKKDMEEEIQRIREKYDTMIQAIQREEDEEKRILASKSLIDVQDFNNRERGLNDQLLEDKRIIKEAKDTKLAAVKTLSDFSNKLTGRINNFALTIKSIYASENDWTAIQCLSDTTAAYNQLIKDVDEAFIQLRSLFDVPVSKSVKVNVKRDALHTMALYDDVTVVEIKAMKSKNQKIHSITSIGKDHITVAGFDSRQYSFLSMIDTKGKELKCIKSQEKNVFPRRFCTSIEDSKVVTVSQFNLICLFDTKDKSFQEKNVSNIVPQWNSTVRLTCVATDPTGNLIYIAANNMKVYVFDKDLSFIVSMDLPKIVKSVVDMAVLEDNLLICDQTGKSAYVLSRRKPETGIKHVVDRPNPGGEVQYPLNVCRDDDGFIFILWSSIVSGQSCRICARYSPDCQKLLESGTIDRRIGCITTMKAPRGRQTLIGAAQKSNKIFIYSQPQSSGSRGKKAITKRGQLESTSKTKTDEMKQQSSRITKKQNPFLQLIKNPTKQPSSLGEMSSTSSLGSSDIHAYHSSFKTGQKISPAPHKQKSKDSNISSMGSQAKRHKGSSHSTMQNTSEGASISHSKRPLPSPHSRLHRLELRQDPSSKKLSFSSAVKMVLDDTAKNPQIKRYHSSTQSSKKKTHGSQTPSQKTHPSKRPYLESHLVDSDDEVTFVPPSKSSFSGQGRRRGYNH